MANTDSLEISPYGDIGFTPELRSGRTFVEDYSLAFNLAKSLAIPDPENTKKVISEAVSQALGDNIPSIRILAVSSLAAGARIRSLRRPHCRNDKDLFQLEKDRFKMKPDFKFNRSKKERALVKNQSSIYLQKIACADSIRQYLEEAESLREDCILHIVGAPR